MRTASAPTTAGLPQPRATTAAWLTSPPRAVRMPSAASMPCDVLGRGLAADQDDRLAPLGRGRGVVGGEVDPADGGARRGAEAR